MWPTFLLEVAQRRIEDIDGPVVLEDLRFPAEVDFATNLGAVTIRFEISKEEQLRRLIAAMGRKNLRQRNSSNAWMNIFSTA